MVQDATENTELPSDWDGPGKVMKDRDLSVKVIKAGCNLHLPRAAAGNPTKIHCDRASEWFSPKAIRIHAVSIPEQTEVSIGADIEVSAAPTMYMMERHIFRAKYAGPAIQRSPPEPTFGGSNVTTTNITFSNGVLDPSKRGTSNLRSPGSDQPLSIRRVSHDTRRLHLLHRRMKRSRRSGIGCNL